jgi:hypothetical protein
MQLITGLFEFLAGGWFFGLWRKRHYRKLEQLLLEKEQQLQIQAYELALKKDALDRNHTAMVTLDKLKTVQDGLKLLQNKLNGNDPLERWTVQDALNRENRAKAALRAIMEQDGCSEESIDSVINSVDGGEDGDL